MLTPISSGSLSVEGYFALAMHFLTVVFSTHLASRSRSVSSSLLDFGSSLLGVLGGFAWSFLCLFARIHRRAASAASTDHQLSFSFAFIYLFPSLSHSLTVWAPTWMAQCIWYAFLAQLLCTRGAASSVGLARIVLPLLFLTEGISHHVLLLELNGGERLVLALLLLSARTAEYTRPIFLLALAAEIPASLLYGHEYLAQWGMLVCGLVVIHEPDADASSDTAHETLAASKGKLAPSTAWGSLGIDGAAGSSDGAIYTANAGASAGWLGSLFTSMGGAFNRRTRAKAAVHKSRRIGGR
jgi:hypothetical protein